VRGSPPRRTTPAAARWTRRVIGSWPVGARRHAGRGVGALARPVLGDGVVRRVRALVHPIGVDRPLRHGVGATVGVGVHRSVIGHGLASGVEVGVVHAVVGPLGGRRTLAGEVGGAEFVTALVHHWTSSL
jgi:hypothetical protein